MLYGHTKYVYDLNEGDASLKPLLGGKDTPLGTKQAAQAALAATPRCTAPAPMATASNGGK